MSSEPPGRTPPNVPSKVNLLAYILSVRCSIWIEMIDCYVASETRKV